MYIYEEWKELSEFISTIDPIQLILDASLDDEYMKVKPLNAYPNINKSCVNGEKSTLRKLQLSKPKPKVNLRELQLSKPKPKVNLREMKRQGLITSKY
jgi:hypothetical protein